MAPSMAKRARDVGRIAGCAGVSALGVIVDVPAMCGIAVAKAPVLLVEGWIHQAVAMDKCVDDRTCGWGVCVPLTLAMMLLWPAQVAASVPSAAVSGVWKGLHAGKVAYKQKSVCKGLRHVFTAIADFHLDDPHLGVTPCHSGKGLDSKSKDKSASRSRKQFKQSTSQLTQQFSHSGDIQLEELFEFMASTMGRDEGRSVVGQELYRMLSTDESLPMGFADIEVVSTIITSFLLRHRSSAPGEAEEGKNRETVDALAVLGMQIRSAQLQKHEEEFITDYVLCCSYEGDEDEQVQEVEGIRKGMLEGFGRMIRGIAAFVAKDSKFKKKYREYLKSLEVEDLIIF